MNSYELIGRLLIMHNNCEDIFSEIGHIVDTIIKQTSNNPDDIDIESLSSILENINSLNSNLDNYKSIVSSFIENKLLGTNIIAESNK